MSSTNTSTMSAAALRLFEQDTLQKVSKNPASLKGRRVAREYNDMLFFGMVKGYAQPLPQTKHKSFWVIYLDAERLCRSLRDTHHGGCFTFALH
jgi:hypothetical protein